MCGKLARTLLTLVALALTAVAFGRPPQPAATEAEIAEATEAIRAAASSRAATAAYVSVSRKAPGSAELRDALVRKLLSLDQPMLAATAARRLTELVPNHGTAWAVMGYVSADRHDLIASFDAYARAGQLLTDDSAVMSNLGQLVAWYDLEPKTPKITAVTRGTLELHLQRWKDSDAFKQGYERIRKGQDAYEKAQQTAEEAFKAAGKQAEELLGEVEQLKVKIEETDEQLRDWERRSRDIVRPGKDIGTKARPVRFAAEIEALRAEKKELYEEKRQVERKLAGVEKTYKTQKRRIKSMPFRRRKIFREAGAVFAWQIPAHNAAASDTGAGEADLVVAAVKAEADELAETGGPIEVIVDNTDMNGVTLKGEWDSADTQSIAAAIGPDYLHVQADPENERSVTFVPVLPANGVYRVSVWLPRHEGASLKTRFSICHVNGNVQFTTWTDMAYDKWMPLGNYEFGFGSSGSVEIRTEDGEGIIVADAVKFERLDGTIIVDNVDRRCVEINGWTASSLAEGSYGVNHLIPASDSPGIVRFKPTITSPGWYDVLVRWPSQADATSNGKLTIHHAGGRKELTLDQRAGGGDWQAVETLEFLPGQARLTFSNEGVDGAMAVDAVKLCPFERILADSEGDEATVTGEWAVNDQIRHRCGDNLLHDNNADKGEKTVQYAVSVPFEGFYDINMIAPPVAEAATNVPVEIAHADGRTAVHVNQRDTSRSHRFVGRFRFTPDTPATVTIRTDDTDGHVFADGVQFTPAPTIIVPFNEAHYRHEGPWSLSGESLSRYHNAFLITAAEVEPNATKTVTVHLPVPDDGWYDIYAWTPSHPSMTDHLPVTVHHADGRTETHLNERDAVAWIKLATCRLNSDDPESAKLVFDATKAPAVSAVDAVGVSPARYVPEDVEAADHPEPTTTGNE